MSRLCSAGATVIPAKAGTGAFSTRRYVDTGGADLALGWDGLVSICLYTGNRCWHGTGTHGILQAARIHERSEQRDPVKVVRYAEDRKYYETTSRFRCSTGRAARQFHDLSER